MKNIALTLAVILAFVCTLTAQYTNVQFDYTKDYFNDGQPLPAEKTLMFTGEVPPNVRYVEVSILSHKAKENTEPMYQAHWQATANNEATNFAMPVNFKLRTSEKYDIRFDYFRPLNTAEVKALTNEIYANMEAYMDVHIMGNKSIKMLKSAKKTKRGLDEILTANLAKYRCNTPLNTIAFTDIIRLKIKHLEDADLTKNYSRKDSTMTREGVRAATRESLVQDLKNRLQTEVTQLLSGEWLVLDQVRYVDNYETEDKPSKLSIGVGYGATYISGDIKKDFTYGSSPYVSLNVPLGNSTFAPKVLSNASLTLGAFTQNFKDEYDQDVTGVIFNRPWFVGLDYKLFQFIRFNAGATMLEMNNIDTGATSVQIRPFVGLGARINLSFGLEK